MPLHVDITSVSPAIEPREDTIEKGPNNFLDDPTIGIDADERPFDGEEDDGQGDYVSPDSVDDLYLRDSGADGDDDLPVAERQSRMWKIDHSFGNYKYKCISPCLYLHCDILSYLFCLDLG